MQRICKICKHETITDNDTSRIEMYLCDYCKPSKAKKKVQEWNLNNRATLPVPIPQQHKGQVPLRFLFSSSQYKEHSDRINASALFRFREEIIYINLAYFLRNSSKRHVTEKVLQEIATSISHEVEHHVLYKMFGHDVSLAMDNPKPTILLNGYFGLRHNYTNGEIRHIVKDYLHRKQPPKPVKPIKRVTVGEYNRIYRQKAIG